MHCILHPCTRDMNHREKRKSKAKTDKSHTSLVSFLALSVLKTFCRCQLFPLQKILGEKARPLMVQKARPLIVKKARPLKPWVLLEAPRWLHARPQNF